MLQKDSYIFRTFVGSRVSEIQTTTDLTRWFWVEGVSNVADWVTRPRNPVEIGQNSIWQRGPRFLDGPREEWPIKQECKVLEIPERIKNVMKTEAILIKPVRKSVINIERFSSMKMLVRTTARVLSVFKWNPHPSFMKIGEQVDSEKYEEAVAYWVKDCQRMLHDEMGTERYMKLCPRKREDGIRVVGSRIDKWVEMTAYHEEPILLPYNHRFTFLYARFVHEMSHPGVATTMAKVRLKYWVVDLKRMVKSIVFKCVICRSYRKTLMSQVMGKLPVERIKAAPPWQSISVDLFGPYDIKGSVNKRTRSKGYGVLFNCLVTRAVYIDIATEYSTDAFLMVLRRFVSIRGYPSVIYSDNGSQLKAASKELKGVIKEVEWSKVVAFGAEDGLTWKFSAPDAPWQNGCAEALVKAAKKAITHAIGKQVLTLNELQTVFFECANILNERPIGQKPTLPEEGSYVCPNNILLGRATSRIPGGPFREYASLKKRLALVQEIADSFWRKMIRNYFPSLLIRQKWHTARRNIKVGDVVLIQDNDALNLV